MKTKAILAILAFLFVGVLSSVAHEPSVDRYERPIMVEEWMTKPFYSEVGTVFLSGTTAEYGKYVIVETDDIYHFMGKEYEVYNVMYDNPEANMKIGVNGKEYIAYTNDFIFFYECTKNGFGVRRVMFNNPTIRDSYNEKEFNQQSILCDSKKIDDLKALGLIAVYVPNLLK
jgi:hypothetical protein